jgi:hypothetical protein
MVPLLTLHRFSRHNDYQYARAGAPGRRNAPGAPTRRIFTPYWKSEKSLSAIPASPLRLSAALRRFGADGILLRLLIEFPLAILRAEIIGRPLILGLRRGLLIIYLRFTNWIRLHCHRSSPCVEKLNEAPSPSSAVTLNSSGAPRMNERPFERFRNPNRYPQFPHAS